MSKPQDDIAGELEQKHSAGTASGDPDSLLIKRAHARSSISDEFVIQAHEEPDQPLYFVKGYNISPNGLGVISKQPLRAQTKVQVQADTNDEDDPWLSGTIVHCTMTVTGYKIGLQFDTEIEFEEQPT